MPNSLGLIAIGELALNDLEREMKLTIFAATGYRLASSRSGRRRRSQSHSSRPKSEEAIRRVDIVNCGPAAMIPAAGPLSLRQAADLPAAIAMTISVVRAFPPIPHDPLFTSSIVTQVTPRMFSPSIETIASVNFSMISFFCFGVNTSSIK
jgi:hypothetical protein